MDRSNRCPYELHASLKQHAVNGTACGSRRPAAVAVHGTPYAWRLTRAQVGCQGGGGACLPMMAVRSVASFGSHTALNGVR